MGAQTTARDIPGLAHDGAGRDVLLIGGLADDASVWDAQVAALRDRYRLTRYSTRGADGSPAPPGPYQMSDFVDDAIAALAAGGSSRPTSWAHRSVARLRNGWRSSIPRACAR